jgi:hypothetical protein
MEVVQEELKIDEPHKLDEKLHNLDENNRELYHNLDEFYYAIEEALEARSTVYEKLEGLEHLNLKKETDDPYLQGLYLKHGMFGPINLKSAFQIFNDIEDEMISYEPWKNMKTPIKAFVCNQLSLFYLGYQGVTERDLECSDIYLKEAIYRGNRMTIASHAEELLGDINIDNLKNHDNEDCNTFNSDRDKLKRATDLFKRAVDAGHKNSVISLIECYKLSRQHIELFVQYNYLINTLGYENYIGPCIRDFKSIVPHSENLTEQFVSILLNCKPSKCLHSNMLEMIHFITEDILDKIVTNGIQDEKKRSMNIQDEKNSNIINNLLFIFNCDSLLYEKYMNKLLKYYIICNQIKECLKN